MLERTAGLESCSLQRVLYKPVGSSKPYRNLRSGFWQHGASAIELSRTWPAVTRGKKSKEGSERDALNQAGSSLQASLLSPAFLLDFLYPIGTYALLRRLYPAIPRPQVSAKPVGAARPRTFASRPSAADAEDPSAASSLDSEETGGRRSQRHQDSLYAFRTGVRATGDRDASGPQTEPSSLDRGSSDWTTAYEQHQPNQKVRPNKLAELLARPRDALYRDVWDAYSRLEPQQKQQQHLLSAVVVYLSESRSLVDIGRATSLLGQIPAQSWNDNLQAAGILLHVRAGAMTAALDMFSTGLQFRGSGAGLQHLLEDALTKKDWATVLKAWLEYFSTMHKKKGTSVPSENNGVQLPAMTTAIPDLAGLYFSLERYLETEAVEAVKAINLHEDTRLGLKALRRWMAEQVLGRLCLPKQAKPVLLIWSDPVLYQKYISRMLGRFKDGLVTRAALALLPEIYLDYRKLSGVKTPIPMLRKLFDFYYPSDPSGLGEVYRDWHESRGDLDQWGYEKYMKFYSRCGDVRAVKELWARYAKLFPEVVKQPLGFRSTLNAFAQIGDVAGAEKEFETMVEEYGVKPDIDAWNTLLKCYSKVNDHERAYKCFEEIRQLSYPDSFTYAQVMAMAAKQGDLDTVLKYFNESQRDKISISRELAMSLVLAYCRNGRLEDAEKICTEFSERNATSAVVWNHLIMFNGQAGKLNKCYELLKTMKRYGVEWDHQTHEFLLRAMVHVGQVQLAYELLLTARRDGAFPVGSEHFAVVLSGAVSKEQLLLAQKILSQMQSAGFEVPLQAHVSLVKAAVRQAPSAERTRRLTNDLVNHVLRMLASPNMAAATATAAGGSRDRNSSSWTAPSELLEAKRRHTDVGRTIMLLIEQRNYTTVEKVMSAYVKAFPGQHESKLLPPPVVSALMRGYLQDGKVDGVHRLWEQTFDGMVAAWTQASGSGIYPGHQYDLTRPLDVVIQAFGDARDGNGLRQTIEKVLDCGFKLTRSNWNLAITYLAELGHWERAMEWCEQMLMPNWTGWTPAAQPVQESRIMKSNRVLAAARGTVFSLQKEWLRLRKLAAWSGGVSTKLRNIEENHPKLHHAFITIDYQHLNATWVVPRKESMTLAIKELLRPLSYTELKAIRNALERQLLMLKSAPRKGRIHSPFHVVLRRDGKGDGNHAGNMQDQKVPDDAIITRAMNEQESNELDLLLKEREQATLERDAAPAPES
ncbi:hypothetical protein E4U55_007255 [Claviceps digitariae]|nr:hypothetical protein E4U55_007255 [Claviceps digitariae]